MTWKTLYVYPNPHALSIAFSDNVGPSNWLTFEGQFTTTEAPSTLVTKRPGGYWPIDKTNIHSIHAGLERGPEFLSIYLSGNKDSYHDHTRG